MTQAADIWIALVGGGIIAGAALVAVLVSQRSFEPLFGVLALGGFAFAVWGFGAVSSTYDRLDAVGYALVFGLAGTAGGYALASTLLGTLATRARPMSPDLMAAPSTSSAMVLVLAEVEPARYSPAETAAALEELSEEGLLEASIAVLPFLFMAQKTRYRAAGGESPGRSQLRALAERVADMLRDGRIAAVETAACIGESSLAVRVAQAVNRGYRDIIVAELAVAESLEIDSAKREVDSMRLAEKGVTVTYTRPLAGSERVASVVSARVMAVAGDPTATGVVLVGQAQPDSRSRDARGFDEQETAFLNRVRMLLVERGLSDQFVRVAWADWRTPELTSTVRHLAALGCRRIVVMPACYPLDSITTLLDIPLSVRQARTDASVSVVTLPAWHDDPGLAEALRAEVITAAESTGSRSPG